MDFISIQEVSGLYWEETNGKFTISNGKYTVVIDKKNRDKIFEILKNEGLAKEDEEFVERLLKTSESL